MRKPSIAGVLLTATIVAFGLTACGETGKSINDAMNIDANQLQDAGAGLSAAGAMCSKASGQVSDVLQSLNKAVADKDLEAAKALEPQLQALADQLHQAEKDGVAAAQGLGSLPGDAGAQATAGTEMGFKACGNTGDEMEGLATAVAGASEGDLNGQLQKQISQVEKDSMDALSQLGNG
jgi:hypothetical protein